MRRDRVNYDNMSDTDSVILIERFLNTSAYLDSVCAQQLDGFSNSLPIIFVVFIMPLFLLLTAGIFSQNICNTIAAMTYM